MRPSHIYVFCHFTPRIGKRNSAEPLNVDQWDFYVLATERLDRSVPHQSTIGLNPLRELTGGPTRFCKLKARIKEVAAKIH